MMLRQIRMLREPSQAFIRRQAGLAFNNRNRALMPGFKAADAPARPVVMTRSAFLAATATPIATMEQLPYLTRRVLRLIAKEPGICIAELDKQADLDRTLDLGSPARPHADSLVLYGYASRLDGRYTLTPEGRLCLAHSPAEADQQLAHRLTYLSNV